jgi:dephospho-CoA kinase
MSKATFTFGRFNPPTETGHGKLVSAVQAHAEKTSGKHYIFPSHSQDSKKNPLSHKDKVGAMNRLFPNANVVASGKVRTAIDAMKHLEAQGHTHVTMVVGSDRVDNFQSLLDKYRTKEYPKIKKVNVVSAGDRDPDAEGAEGMSASKLRELVSVGKKKEFVSHYSDPKLGAHIHDKVKAGMQMESVSPVGIFLLGGPGSGKDYILKNIFSRFDLTEVQADQILTGAAAELFELNKNIVINGANDADKIELVQTMLEGYTFDFVHVSVTNKVSRLRNEQREQPIAESKRIEKYLKAEQLAKDVEAFIFNNSINLNESTEMERVFFGSQIEKILERIMTLGLEIQEESSPKSFTLLREKKFPPVAKDKESGLPKKYVRGLSASTAKARKTHWKKMDKLSDKDPRAYEPAPGDATAKTKPSTHTLAVRKMMDEAEQQKVRRIARSGNITAVMDKRKETGRVSESADSSISAKAKKSGISVGTLRKVYKRGVAAWNSGHRPGTTPQQWGHARVNSYINKGKTYHTADKDLREEADIDELFEMQLVGTDEYRKHAIAMTPGQNQEIENAYTATKSVTAKEDCDCGGECDECNEQDGTGLSGNVRSFSEIRKGIKEAKKEEVIDATPTLKPKKEKLTSVGPKYYRGDLQGLPVTARFNALEAKDPYGFMPTPRQVPGPKAGHPVPPGYERVKSWGGAYELRKIREKPATVKEAVEYHMENEISFTENVFRPGSEMFFEMIAEAKKLYKEGKYTPADEFELDMLNSDIGEKVIFEGQEVILDYPFEEELNEEDKTDGKGIGKPWREGGGGAVYVRDGGSIRKVSFSKSGMKKRYMDPAATRSFVARHRCLTNKDKTSASYWACRWPRFFSNSGKTWW